MMEASLAGVNPIERSANSRRFVERVRVALAALTEPGDEVADRLHRLGRIELFLGPADAFTHPGEIKRLHVSSQSLPTLS